jgi:adenylate cyclase
MTSNIQSNNPPRSPRELRSPVSLRALSIVSALALLISSISFATERRGALAPVELRAYDILTAIQYSRIVPPQPSRGSDTVFNVDFDEESVRQYNAFPIQRLLLADVIAKITSGKPSVIGLDVILDLPRLDSDDLQLAKAIDDAGNVVLISEYGFDSHPPNNPLGIFQKAAAGVGFADLPIDEDGTVRKTFLRVTTKDYKALSLPVALADLFSGQHLRPGGDTFLFFGTSKLPLASRNPDTAWISIDPWAARRRLIPVNQLLSSSFNPALFAGKIVVVGQSSEMGRDIFATPLTRTGFPVAGRNFLSGGEIHAAAVATLLEGNFLSTVRLIPRFIAGFVLAFAVVSIAFRYRWYGAVLSCLLLVLGIFVLGSALFSRYRLWLPLVPIEACILAALPAGLGYRSVEERRLKNAMEGERRQLMGLFERYVSADVAAEIWKNRDNIILAGEERVATILFSDIRSFTAMTAGVPSREVLDWLNRYLTAMGEVIKQNRGFLNKFIGDGIMVIFGAPLTEGTQQDARRAVRCAQEMLAKVDQWNATKPPGDPTLKIGIGIHTGQVTAGNVGSADRLEYSVIGEAVNLASRLESLTKDFKTSLVLSPATWEQVRDQFPTVPLGEAQVRGFTSAIPLYSVETSPSTEVHPR